MAKTRTLIGNIRGPVGDTGPKGDPGDVSTLNVENGTGEGSLQQKGCAAKGENSFASGKGTIASQTGQQACGRYNVENSDDDDDKYLFIVGNGESNDERQNCFTIDEDGNVWVQGNVYVSDGENEDDSERLATRGYVDDRSTLLRNGEGWYSVELLGCTATGRYCLAGGENTVASGSHSFAWGSGAKATGHFSFASGSGTASGQSSHAEGSKTTASGYYSHAEGDNVTASGDYSHAEGKGTTAFGYGSHAEGLCTSASGDYSHVQGKYNIEDTNNEYAHIVGNGSFDTRSNAHTLDWNGNAWFAGDVYVGSTSGTNKDAGSKKLLNESEVQSYLGRTNAVNVANTNYTTLMARGMSLHTADTNPSVNGAICWTYK